MSIAMSQPVEQADQAVRRGTPTVRENTPAGIIGDRAPQRIATVVVQGPAGSGVSRFLTDLSRLGIGYGQVLSGTAHRAELSLLIDAFGATALADDLRGALAGADPCRSPRLARRVADWINSVEGGVLLVLDDVHRADAASADLLHCLLRIGDLRGLTVVIGGRSGRLPSELRGICLAAPATVSVQVRQWTQLGVRQLVPGVSGGRARLLCEAGLGRPALIAACENLPATELRRLDRMPVTTLADHVARSSAGAWRPGGELGATTRRIAAAAALLGTDVDADRIAQVSDLGTDDVVTALTELIDTDVIEVQAGRLRFAHPVLRAVAYRWLEPASRQALHLRAAAVLRAAGASPLDVADHLAVAAKAGDDSAAETLVLAARRRLAVDAGAAVRWAEAALRLLTDPLSPTGDEARYVLAQAQACTGELAAAVELSHDLVANPAYSARATVLLARCERLLGRPALALATLLGERATASAELAAEIEVELLAADVSLGGPARAVPLAADDAGRAARRLLALAARMLRPATGEFDLAAEADAVAQAIDGLSNRSLVSIVDHLALAVWTELRLDRLDDAAAHADRAILVAAGRDHARAGLLLARSAVALRRGELTLALDLTSEVAEYARRLELAPLLACADAIARQACFWTSGQLDSAVGVERPVAKPTGWDRLASVARVDILRQLGRLDDAREFLLPLLANLDEIGVVRRGEWALAVAVEVSCGRLDAARAHYARARLATVPGSRFEAAEVDLAGAMLACGEAGWDEACRLAVSAAETFAALGAPVFAGRARLQAGEAFRLSGDLEAAGREIGAAKQIFQRHGADHLVAVAVNAQKRTAASGSRRLAGGDFGLSTREAEIAELVCQGMTNRLIAHKLFLSVRTVDSHVARILSKVGVGSRVALVGTFRVEPTGVTGLAS